MRPVQRRCSGTNMWIKWIKERIPSRQRTWLTTRKTIEQWSMHATTSSILTLFSLLLFTLLIHVREQRAYIHIFVYVGANTHHTFVHIPLNFCLHSLITWFRTILDFFNGSFFLFIALSSFRSFFLLLLLCVCLYTFTSYIFSFNAYFKWNGIQCER